MRKTAEHKAPPERFWHFLAGETVIDSTTETQRIYRPNGMEAWVLHCTVEGEGEIGRGDERVVVRPGCLMLFPAGAVHDYGRATVDGTWVHLWATFVPRSAWEPWTAWPHSTLGSRQVVVHDRRAWDRVVRRMYDLIEHYRSDSACREVFAMNALEEVILIAFEASGQAHPGGIDSRVAGLMHWVRTHLSEPINVQTLAGLTSLSPSRLAHVFKRHTGTSLMRTVERLRVCRAQELLLVTDAPVKQVASAVGYDDPLYFSHVFRRVVGRSPRQFRGR